MTKICIEIDPDNGNGGTTPQAKFYSTTFGDGVTTVFNVAHNLNSRDVVYWIRNAITGDIDAFDVDANTSDPNVLALTFATPPPASSVRLNVMAPPVVVAP